MTMFECQNQQELLEQFQEHIHQSDDCKSVMVWIGLFVHAYHQVRDNEMAALQYEFEQKLDALTGDQK